MVSLSLKLIFVYCLPIPPDLIYRVTSEQRDNQGEQIDYEDSSDSEEMNWEYYTGLRVVTMFNHKAIEASCEEKRKYILVPGPQAVELIGTEPSIGPHSYLVVKHTENSVFYFQFIGSSYDEDNNPLTSLL